MQNHLFIGLGGQGGNTIAALRRVMESRPKDVEELRQIGTQWDCLYIDSSQAQLNTKKIWKYFGKDLSLNPDSFVSLRDAGSQIDPAALALLPMIAPWIGDPEILKAFLAGNQGIAGANQRRRLGRLLFAQNCANIKSVCHQKIEPMTRKGNWCAIHIFASLAGGTGSGCIVDLVATLRETYDNPDTDKGFPIFLYLYTNDDQVPEAQAGYFHENQAATLRDLNALACGKYHPHLLRTGADGKTFKHSAPINQIILSSPLNSQNQKRTLEEQHQIVAEAAFERIFCYRTGHLTADFQKGITGEDIIAGFTGEPANDLERSYRFGSFGMQQWEVPIEAIREILATDLAQTCFNLILYRNVNEKSGPLGFKVEERNPAYDGLVSDVLKAIRNETIETLHLESLFNKLAEEANRYHQGRVREHFADVDLVSYEQGIQERFRRHLDGAGVDKVFEAFALSRRQRLDTIKKHIHSLLRDALTDAKAPLGFAYFHDALIEIQDQVRNTIVQPDTPLSENKLVRDRMTLRTAEWHKMTFLSRKLRQEPLAAAHRNDMLILLRHELRAKVTIEDNQLLNDLSALLGALALEYQRAGDFLTAQARGFEKRHKEVYQGLLDLVADGQGSSNPLLSNRAEVSLDDLSYYLAQQRLEQRALENTSSSLIHKGFFGIVGTAPLDSLGTLSAPRKEELDETIVRIIFEQVGPIHDSIHGRTHRKPVLTGEVLEILHARYSENPTGFKSELSNFIKQCSSGLLIRENEEQPVGTATMSPMPRRGIVIGLPKGHQFSHTCQELIPQQISNNQRLTFVASYFHDNPTQIRILSLTYWMAARFADVVHKLEANYLESLQSNLAGDQKYFSNLDPSGEAGKRAEILLPPPNKMLSMFRAALWIGAKLDAPGTSERLISESFDGISLLKNTDTGLKPIRLGDSVQSVLQSPNNNEIRMVNEAVQKVLNHQSAERLVKLRQQVVEEDSRMLQTKGAASDEYAEWVDDRDQIYKLLQR